MASEAERIEVAFRQVRDALPPDPWKYQSCCWCTQGYEAVESSVSAYRVHPDSPIGRVLCGIQDNRLPLLPGILASRASDGE